MLSKLNKKIAISEMLIRNSIYELYSTKDIFSTECSFLCIPNREYRKDCTYMIFMELMHILNHKVSVRVTFSIPSRDQYGYTLIWRNGVWYV